jgi:hypothetical protein
MFGKLVGRFAAPLLVLPWGASAADTAMMSAMEVKHEKQLEDVVSGDAAYSSVHSVIKEKREAMSSEEAWNNVDKDADLAMVQQQIKSQEQENFKITEELVDRARARLNKMLTDAYKELDVVVIGCKNDYEMNRKEFSLADGDYTYATTHKKHAKNLMEAANVKIAGYKEAQGNLKIKLLAAQGVFGSVKRKLEGQIRAAKLTMEVGLLILSVTGGLVKKHTPKHQMKGVPGNTRRRWQKKAAAASKKKGLLQTQEEAPLVSNLELSVCTKPDGTEQYAVNDEKIQARVEELQREAALALADSESAVLDEESVVENELETTSFMQLSSGSKKVAFATPKEGAATAGSSCCKAAGTHIGCPNGFFPAKNVGTEPLNLCISCTECDTYTKKGAASWKPNKGDLTKWCRYKQGPTFFNQTPTLNMCPKAGSSVGTPKTSTANSDKLPIDTICTPARRAGQTQYGDMHDSMSRSIGEDSDKHFMLKRTLAKEEKAFKKKADAIKSDQVLQGELINQEQEALREMDTQVSMLSKAAEKADAQRKRLNISKAKILNKCKKQIKDIMQTTICGQTAVRDEVQNQSKVTKASEIVDCVMGDKFEYGTCMKGTSEITCDDSNGHPGGIRNLTRINEQPNSFGFVCPPSTFKVRCARHGCPVDCVVPDFRGSNYGSCNVRCGVGFKTAYRRPSVNPVNGGMGCPTLVDKKTCQKPPCDRNCELGSWGKLSGCSQACGGGMQTQQRKIVKQPIGNGSKCPPADSGLRFRYKKGCNKTKCYGDEICEARMDLVVLIDSSGSVGNQNFFLLTALVKELVLKMNPRPNKFPGMRVSVVRYGNGFIMKDGTNTPAEKIWPVGVDPAKGFAGGDPKVDGMKQMEALGKAIQQAKFQRGFTNLAQGLLKAKNIFQHSSRYPDVNFRRILILTDGHASFREQAMVAKRAVEKQGITIQIVNFKNKYIPEMGKFASMPRGNNILGYNSFAKINSKAGRQSVVKKIIEKFCPKSVSPTGTKLKIIKNGIKLSAKLQLCNGYPSQFVALHRMAKCRTCRQVCRGQSRGRRHRRRRRGLLVQLKATKTRRAVAVKQTATKAAGAAVAVTKDSSTEETTWGRRRRRRRRAWSSRRRARKWNWRRLIRRRRAPRCRSVCSPRCQKASQCGDAGRKAGVCHFQMAAKGRWKGACFGWKVGGSGKNAQTKPGECPCLGMNKARGLCKFRKGTSWTPHGAWKVYEVTGGKCIPQV